MLRLYISQVKQMYQSGYVSGTRILTSTQVYKMAENNATQKTVLLYKMTE